MAEVTGVSLALLVETFHGTWIKGQMLQISQEYDYMRQILSKEEFSVIRVGIVTASRAKSGSIM